MNTYKALCIRGKWYCTNGVTSEACSCERVAADLARMKNEKNKKDWE